MKKTFNRHLAALAIATAFGVSTSALAAGSSTGSITGSVSGLHSGKVSVLVRNPATGFERNIELDSDGSFRFPQLAIGDYEISVLQAGAVLDTRAIRVTVGSTADARFELARNDMEVISVVAARVSAVDMNTSDSGLTIGEAEFDRLPVGRTVTAITLLAPGTVQGEDRFGNLASFSGSSVAENVCYINGMNVTDPEKGLGCGTVPFEFYKEFQVKTGGYSAQYGRSTGGVINAVTKSGTNEFEFGATAYYTPDYLGDGRVVKNINGTVYKDTTSNEFTELNVTVSAGGPIIEDHLFFYAIYNPRKSERNYAYPSRVGGLRTQADTFFHDDERSDAFWGLKLDWEINDRNRLSYFGFSDDSTNERTRTAYDTQTHAKDPSASPSLVERKEGGDTHTLTFNSDITDDFSLSVLAGRFKTDLSIIPSDADCPSVADNRPVPSVVGCGSGSPVDNNELQRDALRIDFEWALDNHLIRFGYDKETIEAEHTTVPAGGASYTYGQVGVGAIIQGTDYTNNTGAPLDYVSKRVFTGGGKFKTENYAYYIEDVWSVTDQLNLTLGIRSDVATNYGKTGVAFVKLDNQIAPRLGLTYDPTGDGSSKIFANYGEYFFPVPINTNYRTASGIADMTEYLTFTGINGADGTPSGTTLLDTNINGTGSIPDPGLSAAPEYSAQSLQEYIIGYQTEFNDEYSGTVRATYRTTNNMGDDYCGEEIDPTNQGSICTLFNPGKGHTFAQDVDGDGKIDPGSQKYYSAEELGIPEGKRDYSSVQFELVHRSENLMWTAQYVWSHSYGNNEGGVNSDNLQTDTGVSSFLDFKASAIGANGNLPNDRRHAFKFYGSYSINDDLSVGWNASLIDGRPLSIRGRSFPTDLGYLQPPYGDTYYVFNSATQQYVFNSRGSNGRSPWVFSLDASMTYKFSIGETDGRISLDVFNLLDTSQTLAINELAETQSGTPNPYYGLPMTMQTPRQLRLGLNLAF
ncbi:TonB-dependent receptor [Bowmanella sp. Y26]|uniref:TonB-dependent receptor n=1 Tax=Bowmanella yangjiangensis TaxID=2811230 RepID=UPI001BDCD0D6|nr:carboxypeptidase regulatory-like domain-containing protein [Bowmanella yangjiangensis]MBT1064630.1 TonB-dependent receptor [Bowmanella yangjiangensis]